MTVQKQAQVQAPVQATVQAALLDTAQTSLKTSFFRRSTLLSASLGGAVLLGLASCASMPSNTVGSADAALQRANIAMGGAAPVPGTWSDPRQLQRLWLTTPAFTTYGPRRIA